MTQNAFWRSTLIVAALLLIGLTGLAKDEAASAWAVVPVNIDGMDTDWAGVTLVGYDKAKVDYAFKNDGEYLYILFIFNDPEYLSSINETGMTVYYHPQGKKKKDYGVTFSRMRISADEFIALLENKQGPIPEEKKDEIQMTPHYYIQKYEVINEESDEPEEEAGTAARKAVFRSAKVQNMSVFEFAIPLERTEAMAPAVGAAPGDNIKVGFEWGGMTDEMKKQRMQNLAAQSSRASDVRAGDLKAERDQESSNSPSLSSIRKKSPKRYSFWVDVALAKQ